jgi:hypothetical protein
MDYIDRLEILEMVKEIKELQSKITEGNEFLLWYGDVVNIDNFQPCEDLYKLTKEELPELRIKLVEVENRLERLVFELEELE